MELTNYSKISYDLFVASKKFAVWVCKINVIVSLEAVKE